MNTYTAQWEQNCENDNWDIGPIESDSCILFYGKRLNSDIIDVIFEAKTLSEACFFLNRTWDNFKYNFMINQVRANVFDRDYDRFYRREQVSTKLSMKAALRKKKELRDLYHKSEILLERYRDQWAHFGRYECPHEWQRYIEYEDSGWSCKICHRNVTRLPEE